MSDWPWMIWRCRLDSSTTSKSTMPSVPTPAAARYSSAGDPRPPAPTHEHLGVLQALLPGHPDVGDDQVAGVALDLVDGQLGGRLDQRWQRHDAISWKTDPGPFYPAPGVTRLGINQPAPPAPSGPPGPPPNSGQAARGPGAQNRHRRPGQLWHARGGRRCPGDRRSPGRRRPDATSPSARAGETENRGSANAGCRRSSPSPAARRAPRRTGPDRGPPVPVPDSPAVRRGGRPTAGRGAPASAPPSGPPWRPPPVTPRPSGPGWTRERKNQQPQATRHPRARPAGPARQPASPGWPGQFAQVLAETLAGSRSQGQIVPWTTDRARAGSASSGPCLRPEPRRVRRVDDLPSHRQRRGNDRGRRLRARVRALAVRLEGRRAARPARAGRTGRARWVCTAIEAAYAETASRDSDCGPKDPACGARPGEAGGRRRVGSLPRVPDQQAGRLRGTPWHSLYLRPEPQGKEAFAKAYSMWGTSPWAPDDGC